MRARKTAVFFSAFLLIACLIFYAVARKNDEAMSVIADVTADNAVIIVDAGHGGIDGGTSAADGTLEKDINLSIALKLDGLLRLCGYNSLLTRSSDESIHDSSAQTTRQKKVSDIHNRLAALENTENSILVSIHQNHYSQSRYTGTQVFFSKNNPMSRELANSIQQSVVAKLQPDNTREIKGSGTEIYILYHASRPAVMVECGFLSNAAETQILKSDEYQTMMALAILDGITDYFITPGDV